jgi:hypothetical protein
MAGALEGVPVTRFNAPPGVQQADVCSLSAMLPTQECRDNALPIHGIRKDWFVPGVNMPTKPDDWHQRIEVCKVNGKRSTPLVPDNAREQRVFVSLPEPGRTWGATHGFASAPTDDCTDAYRGRVVQILAPGPADRITAGQTLQVLGSAYSDDFAKYTLDFGPGDNPALWTPITDQRVQSVDKALLGVWNTSGLQPGRYRLRLRVFDRFLQVQESPPVFVTVGPVPGPTLQPSATSTVVGTTTRATPTPSATATRATTTTPATTTRPTTTTMPVAMPPATTTTPATTTRPTTTPPAATTTLATTTAPAATPPATTTMPVAMPPSATTPAQPNAESGPQSNRAPTLHP